MDKTSDRLSRVPMLMPGTQPPGPGPVRFTLAEIPERDRLPVYRDFFGRSVCRFEIDPLEDVPFEVDVMLHSLPNLQLFTGRVQGSRCGRPPSVLGDGTDDIALVVNLGGRYLAALNEEEIVLDDGDATIVSEAEPFFLTHRPPGSLLVLRTPRACLSPLVRGPEDRRLPRIPHSTRALQLLINYVKIAWDEPTLGNRALQQLAATHLHDLIALAVGATRDGAELAQGRGLRAAKLHAIKEDIARNLGRPDLSAATLARRHACTLRFVQRLFEGEGTTFTEYVLAQRLARAHRVLRDPRRADDKISAIALESGFGDVSHFNRAFRRRFGAAPSDIRAQALNCLG